MLDSKTGEDISLESVKWLLLCAPIIVYISFINRFGLNIPRQDDYDAVLVFLNNYKHAPLGQKISLVFQQHNEHRILSSRIVYAAYLHLFGNINFKAVMYLNTIMLIGLYALIVGQIRKLLPANWYVASLVLAICLFDLNNYENAVFAMAGMLNYGIIFFFVLSMYLYSKNGRFYTIGAVLFQALCVFSSGNGGVAAFVIALYAWLGCHRQQRIVATAGALVFAPLYYVGYHQPPTDFFTLDPSKFVPYFLHAMGAHFSKPAGPVAAIALFTVALLCLPFRKREEGRGVQLLPESALLLCLALFILASMGVMSIFRGNLPLDIAYSSRYFIYSHLFVAIVFVFVLAKTGSKPFGGNLAIGTLLLLTVVYGKNFVDGSMNFEGFYNSMKGSAYDYPNAEHAKDVADKSCKLMIYCLDEAKAQAR